MSELLNSQSFEHDHASENGDETDLLASEEYWIKTTPGLKSTTFARSELTPSVVYPRGRVRRLWRRSQIEVILKREQQRHRGGLYTDPITGEIAATVYSWQQEFHMGKDRIARKLDAITATPHPPPSDALFQEHPFYTSHTVTSALEDARNRYQPVHTLTPDPERQTVTASIEAWATFLDIHHRVLHLSLTDRQPVQILGRSRAKIFTYEQVAQALPTAFHPPLLLARKPGMFLYPGTKDRYIVSGALPFARRLQRHNVPSVQVLSSGGRPATYYKEADIEQFRSPEDRKTEPVTWTEYMKSVAAYHRFPYHAEQLEAQLSQATYDTEYKVHELDTRGTLHLHHAQLVPVSVFLDVVNREINLDRRARIAQIVQQSDPITLQDVTWPGHWSGRARLWFYDLEEFERAVRSEYPEYYEYRFGVRHTVSVPVSKEAEVFRHQTPESGLERPAREMFPPSDNPRVVAREQAHEDSAELKQVRRSLAAIKQTPPTPVPKALRTPALDKKEQARLRNQRAREQTRMKEQAKATLNQVRQQFAKSLRRIQDRPHELHEALAALVEKLTVLPEAPMDLDLSFIEKEFQYYEHEVFATPFEWTQRFGRLFPKLTEPHLADLLRKGEIAYHETFQGVPILSERDIMATMLKFVQERVAST